MLQMWNVAAVALLDHQGSLLHIFFQHKLSSTIPSFKRKQKTALWCSDIPPVSRLRILPACGEAAGGAGGGRGPVGVLHRPLVEREVVADAPSPCAALRLRCPAAAEGAAMLTRTRSLIYS